MSVCLLLFASWVFSMLFDTADQKDKWSFDLFFCEISDIFTDLGFDLWLIYTFFKGILHISVLSLLVASWCHWYLQFLVWLWDIFILEVIDSINCVMKQGEIPGISNYRVTSKVKSYGDILMDPILNPHMIRKMGKHPRMENYWIIRNMRKQRTNGKSKICPNHVLDSGICWFPIYFHFRS